MSGCAAVVWVNISLYTALQAVLQKGIILFSQYQSYYWYRYQPGIALYHNDICIPIKKRISAIIRALQSAAFCRFFARHIIKQGILQAHLSKKRQNLVINKGRHIVLHSRLPGTFSDWWGLAITLILILIPSSYQIDTNTDFNLFKYYF